MIPKSYLVILCVTAALSQHPVSVAGAEKSPAHLRSEGSHDPAPDLRLRLEPKDGSVEFLAVGWPGALSIRGKGARPDGTIRVEGRNVSGVVGLDLATLDTGIDLRNRHMKDRYLEVSKYPRAELRLSRLAIPDPLPVGEFQADSVAFEGALSLHGVTRLVRGLAHIRRKADAVDVVASFEINTNDFGIEAPGYMGVTVAEKIKVKVQFSSLVLPAQSAER